MKHWLGMHWCFFALMSDVFDMLEVEQLWRFSQCMVTSTCGFMMTKACIMNFTTLVRCLCWQMQSSVLEKWSLGRWKTGLSAKLQSPVLLKPCRCMLVSKAKLFVKVNLVKVSSVSPPLNLGPSRGHQVALALRDAGGRQKLLKKPTPLTVRSAITPNPIWLESSNYCHALYSKVQTSLRPLWACSCRALCNSQ